MFLPEKRNAAGFNLKARLTDRGNFPFKEEPVIQWNGKPKFAGAIDLIMSGLNQMVE